MDVSRRIFLNVQGGLCLLCELCFGNGRYHFMLFLTAPLLQLVDYGDLHTICRWEGHTAGKRGL